MTANAASQTDPDDAAGSSPDPARATPPAGSAPHAGATPPDAGVLEPVEGTTTGLRREVGRMEDGRRITYYWSRAGSPA